MKHLNIDWWNNFATSTESLEKPVLFKSALDDSFNEIATHLFYRLQQNTHLIQHALSKIRVYVNEGLRKDLSLELLRFPINKNESLQLWCQRFFKNERYLISFSDFSIFDHQLTLEFTKFLSPFFKIFGIPMFTHLTFFIGNYGYTPFGVHIDVQGLRAIHLHLGPGRKKMYLWHPNSLKDFAPDVINFMNPNEFMNVDRREYLIEPNDIFFFPVDKYFHVGSNIDEFSVAISVGINNIPFKDILSKYVTNLMTSRMSQDELAPMEYSMESGNEVLTAQHSHLKDILDFGSSEVLGLTSNIRSDFLSKLSSYGFSAILDPFEKKEDVKLGEKFIIVAPFKIYTQTIGESLEIYARNRRLKVKNDILITNFIDQINLGKEILVSTDAELLLKKYDEASVRQLMTFLITSRVLKKYLG